ncbi:MAG: ABC transporter permease [Chloroflexi bacterium]|nr:ABC transporter permease [Chloroflexota bacterium]
MLLRHFTLLLGSAILMGFIAVAWVGPDQMKYEPEKVSRNTYEKPSPEYRFGTDKFGRDILTRVVYATRLDLRIAMTVAVVSFVVGSVIGAIVGYYGGRLDSILMRGVDILFAFPAFLLAMVITGVLGDSEKNVITAVTIAYIPYFVRLTRGQMLTVRTLQYADAAISIGNPSWRVILIHLLPNTLTPSLIQMSMVAGWAILDTAGLAFLGLGITSPTAEWGVMISDGAQRITTGEWWMWLYPGAALVLAAFAFNLIGDGLRNLLRLQ